MVGDSPTEEQIAADAGVHYAQAPNDPLGRKWQAGVDQARMMEPDALLILGSDTWLSNRWVETISKYLDEFDLVGKNQWHVCHPMPGLEIEIIQRGYYKGGSVNHPVGGGRMVSRRILDKVDWQIYDTDQSRGLDTYCIQKLWANDGRSLVVNHESGVKILGIKGPWGQLNGFANVKHSPNLLKLPTPENPREWLDKWFPGAVEQLKHCVEGVIIG